MMPIRSCPTDGYFEGKSCPVCGAAGTHILSASRREQLSKFTSGALRHFPGDVGIELDERGWTDLDALVARTDEKYDWFEPAMLEAVVATDPKGRFELDGDRIRATYGHSVPVSLERASSAVPDAVPRDGP